ncbi:MAG: hypothetical protein AB4041_04480 [Microcystaceae cyanobacterium]
MTKITEQTSLSKNKAKTSQQWWHRPLIGEGSILEALLGGTPKEEVSENAVVLHRREMMDIKVFAKTAKVIDNEKFCNAEFLQFVRVKYALAKGLGEYGGLGDAMQLLQVAIEAKDSFISIDQTELRYRGSKQQDFYQYVQTQLEEVTDKNTFREHIAEYIGELIPQVKTEEGKAALSSYNKHLEQLSDHQLGLKLLSLFKTYELADYSILRTISEMIQGLHKADLMNFKGLVALVMVNYQVFEKLRKIIGVSAAQHKPETYALMIQYIALSNRHAISYMKFDELLGLLKKWSKPYFAIKGIREAHPADQYKQPEEFSEPIPGLEVYQKYKKSLTDPKTGMVYIDFDS